MQKGPKFVNVNSSLSVVYILHTNKQMAGVLKVEKSWIFESTLGSGGFGIVQLWKNTHNGEKIAIKMCKSGNDQLTPRQKERWIDEIKIMNHLQHPNIIGTRPVPDEVKLIEPSLLVLCMEYCRKGDLRCVLNQTENSCGLIEPDVIQIMKDISGAVEYLHSHKLTHRDLKPENVVLQQMNDKVVYKLIDLGYAKTLGHDSVYASIVGTLNYVAPELLWKQKYTCSVDYWSLGILFYEIMTGCRPFLPDESNPVTWRKHIESKSYEDICVQNINGSVVFVQYIQEPTHITPCIRDALVDWFRIVLQWDAKKRGRHPQDNLTNEIVVFKMLKRILSKKVIHIFCVYQYKIYSYQIDDSTSFSTLQSLIERDTKISISGQELINSSGDVLNGNQILQDTFITLFRKDGMEPVELPAPNLPALVKKMLETPKAELSRFELKRCYSAAMFFVKKEVELFSHYILALSMKIDLINSRFDTLLSKNVEMLSGIDSLKQEVHSMNELLQCDIKSDLIRWQEAKQTEITKLEHLSETVNDLKAKCDQFLRIREILREFGDVDWMTEYQDFLNQVQDIMENCRIRPNKNTHQPVRMAVLIVKFLKFRQTRILDEKLAKIGSHIRLMTTVQATEELLKLEQYVDSAIALTTVYRKEISNLHKMWQNENRAVSSDINMEDMDVENNTDDVQSFESSMTHSTDEVQCLNSDSVIYDNLVIRYMMHDVMSDTYEKFLEITNLDT